MIWVSSWSFRTRSRAICFAGIGTPSAGDRSRTARPTHQRKNVLITFKVLFAAPGAPRCSMAEITSTTSLLVAAGRSGFDEPDAPVHGPLPRKLLLHLPVRAVRRARVMTGAENPCESA